MGAAEVTARSGTASPRCRCGHAKPRHNLPGFDGECSGCRCQSFRPTARANATRHAPCTVSPAERRLVESWTDEIVAEIDALPHRNVPANGDRRRRSA